MLDYYRPSAGGDGETDLPFDAEAFQTWSFFFAPFPEGIRSSCCSIQYAHNHFVVVL
jgi:hypothetical protein